MTLNRRTLIGGALSIPLVAIVPKETVALPDLKAPLIFEESSTFCQIQNLKTGEFFNQLNATLSKNDSNNSDFPEMTYKMETVRLTSYDKLLDYSYDSPYDIIKQCLIREIRNSKESLKFEFNRMSSEIARKSRRGLAYVILCHPKKLEYVNSLGLCNCDIHTFSELPEDEYVILYNNMKITKDMYNGADGAIYKVVLDNKEPKYIPNLNFKDYIIRFRISEVL